MKLSDDSLAAFPVLSALWDQWIFVLLYDHMAKMTLVQSSGDGWLAANHVLSNTGEKAGLCASIVSTLETWQMYCELLAESGRQLRRLRYK